MKLEYRNPGFIHAVRIAFPISHSLLFLGLPLLAFISLKLGYIDIDPVYFFFAFAFSGLFICFRLNLAKKASGAELKFEEDKLNYSKGGSTVVIDRLDVRQAIFSEPLIIIRVKRKPVDPVIHILVPDHEVFLQISELPFFKDSKK